MGVNILANLFGRFWAIGVGLAFVPIYINLLGIESYGLIAFYSTLVTVMGILDLGLTSTINRELARSAAKAADSARIPDLVRTLELIYWGIGGLLGIAVVLLAPFIGVRWLRADHVSKETLVSTVRLMGLVLALQWPASLYGGGLLGLQRQVLLNGITSVTSTLRFAGGAFMLWKVSRTTDTFFLWQAAASGIATLTLAAALWHQPELRGKAYVRWALLREVGQYATGVASISVLSIILMQADKLILTKLVPLEAFAYYGLASQVSSSISYVVSPIMAGIFPALCVATSENDEMKLRSLFRDGAGLVGGTAIPIVVFVVFFARDIVFAWQRNATTAERTGPILVVLAGAAAFTAFYNMPYHLLLARGHTRTPILANIFSLAVLVPLLALSIPRLGVMGAALSGLIVNALMLCALPHSVFQGELRNDKWSWLTHDVIVPTLCASVPLAAIRLVFLPFDRPVGILSLGVCALISCAAGLLSAAPTRRWVERHMGAIAR